MWTTVTQCDLPYPGSNLPYFQEVDGHVTLDDVWKEVRNQCDHFRMKYCIKLLITVRIGVRLSIRVLYHLSFQESTTYQLWTTVAFNVNYRTPQRLQYPVDNEFKKVRDYCTKWSTSLKSGVDDYCTSSYRILNVWSCRRHPPDAEQKEERGRDWEEPPVGTVLIGTPRSAQHTVDNNWKKVRNWKDFKG